ncbi:MAG: cytochrome c peroxidase [Prevotella sp.]
MKKSSILITLGAAAVAAVAIGYTTAGRTPDPSLPANEQMLQILDDGGCAFCHTANPELPAYASLPVVKSMIMSHVEAGYKSFDIGPAMSAISEGKAVGEVDLAKIEKCLMDGTMPLISYYMVHWGAKPTSGKTAVSLEWVRQHRAKFYPNELASEEFRNDPVRPIPDSISVNPAKVLLGEALYHDARLSGDGTVTCATCHGVGTAGVDNLQYSKGIDGQFGGINAPTSFNACFNFVQFWDGRAATLAEQAAGPPLNPVEMGSKSFDEIVEKLSADAEFSGRFLAVYPEGMNQATITDAIAEYEKTLITPNSPFDKFLKGDAQALTAEEAEGYSLFKQYNCATCHAGVNMGGLSYELMGKREDYFKDREINSKSGLTDADNGRWAQTGVERDRYRFKTPSLRNIALTWPYYHDGSVATLEKAVEMMAQYQVGKTLSAEEVAKITSFLNTLTGEYQGKPLTNSNTR